MNLIPNNKTSPMMLQWQACKKQSQEALLLFRMGDFYEAFYEDAEKLSQLINITLTQRQGIPMAGVPAVSLESTLEKLAAKGLKIAIAEQMEDPKKAKGLVDRQVVKIVTPGTFTSAQDTGRQHNFIVCLSIDSHFALSVCDIATADLWTFSAQNIQQLEAELYRLKPKEVICESRVMTEWSQLKDICQQLGAVLSFVNKSAFNFAASYAKLTEHFQVHSLDSFGLKGSEGSVETLGALFEYLSHNLKYSMKAIQLIRIIGHEGLMQIDRNSQRNLEITEPLYEGQWQNTLLFHLDKTVTPMGSRRLKEWLIRPLCKSQLIHERLDAVEELIHQPNLLAKLRSLLAHIRDLKRLSSKVINQQASPKDLVALRSSLNTLPQLQEYFTILTRGLWVTLKQKIYAIPQASELLGKSIEEEPANKIGEGRVIRAGYYEPLDKLREFRAQSQDWLAQYQNELKEKLSIKTLKVAYTPAFGYYIEVSKGQAALIPNSFTRRQTLVASERFITPELKQFEDKALNAQEQIDAIERELLEAITIQLQPYCIQIDQCAEALAQADCLLSLAECAKLGDYQRPEVNENDQLIIKQGRHPIIERMIGPQNFVANDTHLGNHDSRMMVITGPNMAGKSTYIRQVALLVLMAQIGSFVPAKNMTLGVIDRIFTRVGASDDLARGQSTFMVEMTETANILHHATSKSLVILDEVGRGTSTWDGIAIARAIAEHLLTEADKNPKTLFATHYSELTDLALLYPQAKNYQVAVKEWQDNIIFMHQIQPGSADRSYGIHVAQLAGLPAKVIRRALTIQLQLEKEASKKEGQLFIAPEDELLNRQLSLTSLDLSFIQHLVSQIEHLDLNQMTPLQALNSIADLKQLCHDNPNLDLLKKREKGLT